ncbi:sigma-70 family RNA polymerase sigma factor [Lampropedia cohaerens]|uniref:sigma-70 family RNA polymerase sigma factor n=1 Tax=Lampropedia cohaerens TaxID=1610491 RepID=UPI0018D231F8|nr:sigma-70 family RNA polymerase sigma factor [Lampropedia cohaerens]
MFKTYYDELLHHFTRRTGTRHAAEDAVMEAYLRALQHMHAGHTIRQPRAFLYHCVRNLLASQARRSAIEADALQCLGVLGAAHSPSPEEQLDARQRLVHLQHQLNAMPAKRRDAFVLVRVHGMRYAEAAAYLGSTTAAVEKHVARALQMLHAESGATAATGRAILLLGRLQHGEPAVTRKAGQQLQRLALRDSDHANALACASRLWAQADGSKLRTVIDLPPAASAPDNPGRRAGLLAIAAMLLAGGGWGARWYWRQPLWNMALQTGLGQHLRQRMPEGSNLELAPNTRADARLYRHRRIVQLLHGEMALEVRADARRPFIVQTSWGQVRVLGTRFSVASHAHQLQVAVASGSVAVYANGAADVSDTAVPSIVLQPGHSVVIDAHGVQAVTPIAPQDVAAWTQGWLVFAQTPLPHAISRWNQYLRTPLVLPEDRADVPLRISGRYRIADPESFLRALQDMYGLQSTRRADGCIALVAPALQRRR